MIVIGVVVNVLAVGFAVLRSVAAVTATTLICAVLMGLALPILRSGRPRFAVAVVQAVALLELPLLIILIGPRAGLVLFFAILMMNVALIYRAAEWRARVVVTVCVVADAALVLALGHFVTPILTLPESTLQLFFYANTSMTLLGVVTLAYMFAAASDRAEATLGEERARSERLLRNILPNLIAERLKRSPGTIADAHPMVTVLFADIVGFTVLSTRKSGSEVVRLLSAVFSTFDELAERYELEKIKTIGDAYMAVGGLPEPKTDHAQRVAEMALEMREQLKALVEMLGEPLEIRIGVHSGPVVAGVIGTRKFSYDLWGDTVNTASRMESHGVPGEIQVSEETWSLLRDRYALEERGVVHIKGKGDMRTFFLRSRRASDGSS
jgi:class 3 adenylate cyclase